MIKRLILGLTLSSGGVITAIFLIEVAFRLLPRQHETKWQDRPLSYFRPESSQTLQDFKYPQKEDGTYRIAVIGDSFSFGPYLQFDDTFSKRLERWLNLNQNQKKVEVINYGVPRYSTYHEIPVVTQAINEKADLILLQITLNDPEIKVEWPTELLPSEGEGSLAPKGWLFRHWRSLAFVVERIRNRTSQRLYKEYFYKLFRQGPEWGQFQGSMKKIRDIVRTQNIPTAAIIFPLFGMTVNDNYPFLPQHRKIHKLLDAYHIRYLDLTEAYRDIPVERLQVLPGQDRHPNEIGHRIAAEQILSWLEKSNFLPEEIFPKGVEPQRVGITPQHIKTPSQALREGAAESNTLVAAN